MSRSISDLPAADICGFMRRSPCRTCRRRQVCPYSCDRVFDALLGRAASQGNAAAQLLMVGAQRLSAEISCAGNVQHLLRADIAAEAVLYEALRRETAFLASLFVSDNDFA